MKMTTPRNIIYAALTLLWATLPATAQPPGSLRVPANTLLKIVRYEDQRNWNDEMKALLGDSDATVRARAALAAGRIGDENAVPLLAEIVLTDRDSRVRQMAAFALGEIESAGGAYSLMEVLKRRDDARFQSDVRARALEALAKIAAAMSPPAPSPTTPGTEPPKDERLETIRGAVLDALKFEADRRSAPDLQTILLGLTAVLRVRPEGAGPVVVRFLNYNPQIIAAALNTMARLRLKDNNERVRQLLNHSDPLVRANAARVIGTGEHKEGFEEVLSRALHDSDLRVRANAIRSLAILKDTRAVEALLARSESLMKSPAAALANRNELLEIAATIGRLLPNSSNDRAVAFLQKMQDSTKGEALEVEVAFARVAPATYLTNGYHDVARRPDATWRQLSRRAQALSAIKEVIADPGSKVWQDAQSQMREMLERASDRALAIPDLLQAYAPTLSPDMARQLLTSHLMADDVIVRATAAELLGNQPSSEANARTLAEALPRALKDVDNDAALAILSALAKQKTSQANDAIKSALGSADHLARRRAVALLKANGAGDFSDRIGLVKTRYTAADYRRALGRIGKKVTATVVTSKGAFTIQFLPEDAPLNVDNFIQLAKRGFFNGQTVPRVVPNFVVQAGDPRGDQNGGPGYQIRCEINQVPYERAAVGMALSGKDTGGSQWFVTHSPQPHLDGGYTVFGRVVRGMNTVDSIIRGDRIVRVIVNER